MGDGHHGIDRERAGEAKVGEVALAREARTEERDETATQEGSGLEASQHAGTTQDGEPEKRQLQQRPKLKPRVQRKEQPEPQHKPKRKPTPFSPRRWETVQPRTQSPKAPASLGPAPHG